VFTRPIIVLWVAVLAVGSICTAQPSLDVLVPDGEVFIGDRVPVRVIARGGDDWLWGDLTVRVRPAGPWEVVEGPRSVSGAHPPAWEVILAVMAVGEEALPEIEVTARPPDSDAQLVKASLTHKITVTSVLPADQEVEPAPLRDPVGVGGFPWEWVLPAAAAAMPLVALLAWWIARRRSIETGDAAISLPPIDQLERLLERLMAAIGRDPAEGVCDRLAQGVRGYLERRSGEPALEMTSYELRGLARGNRWPEGVQRSLQVIMATVDGVRFGRRNVTESELRGAIEAAAEAGRELEGYLAAGEEAAAEAAR
jgi:hypothetical protein